MPRSFNSEPGDGSGGGVIGQGEGPEEAEQTKSVDVAFEAGKADNSEDSASVRTVRSVGTTRMAERDLYDFCAGVGASSSRTTDREAIPVYEGKSPNKLIHFNIEKLDQENIKVWKNSYGNFLELRDCWQVVELTHKWRKDPDIIRRLFQERGWRLRTPQPSCTSNVELKRLIWHMFRRLIRQGDCGPTCYKNMKDERTSTW